MKWLINIFKTIKNLFLKQETKSAEKKELNASADSVSDAVDTIIATATQNIGTLTESYQNALDELKKQANEAEKKIQSAQKEFKKINDEVAQTKNLVVFGFLLIVIMIIGVFIGYWIIAINKDSLGNDVKFYENNIGELKIEINDLKNQLQNLKTLNPYLR